MNLLAGEAACIRAVYGPVWVLPVFGTSVPGIVRPGRGTPMGRRTGRLMEIGKRIPVQYIEYIYHAST